jgi:hypothetical protein
MASINALPCLYSYGIFPTRNKKVFLDKVIFMVQMAHNIILAMEGNKRPNCEKEILH